jgi:hypothetical protein
MTGFEFKTTMWNQNVTFNWDFDAKTTIKALEQLKEKVCESFVVDCCNPTEIFHMSSNDHFCDWYVLLWIKAHFNVEDAYSLATEDTEWTAWRNREYNGVYYRKYTFNPEVQTAVIDQATEYQKALNNALNEYAEKQAEEKAKAEQERSELLDGVNWGTEEKIIFDEGGKVAEYIHRFIIDGNKYTIIERNVFDFGRVLNLPAGGMYLRSENEVYIDSFIEKKGWERTKVEDPNETKAAMIVFKYGKYANSAIRM